MAARLQSLEDSFRKVARSRRMFHSENSPRFSVVESLFRGALPRVLQECPFLFLGDAPQESARSSGACADSQHVLGVRELITWPRYCGQHGPWPTNNNLAKIKLSNVRQYNILRTDTIFSNSPGRSKTRSALLLVSRSVVAVAFAGCQLCGVRAAFCSQ